MILQLVDGGLPDAPFGHVDDPQQAQGIIGIVQHFEVGHHIPDLLAVIEFHAAYHAVADAAFDQHLFKNA